MKGINAILVAGYKGGSGKSTLSAALAATMFKLRTIDGEPVTPIWVWADRYAQNDLSHSILDKIFQRKEGVLWQYFADRGFGVCLRENFAAVVQALKAKDTIHRYIFIIDSGANLVRDAAATYVPVADAILLPANRSGAADGTAKMLDSLAHIGMNAEGKVDPSVLDRVATVLTEVPNNPEARAAYLRKAALVDFMSVSHIKNRLLDEPMRHSPAAVDVADLRQAVNQGTLKRLHKTVTPLAREILAKAGYGDRFIWDEPESTIAYKTRLLEEVDRALAEDGAVRMTAA